MSKGQSRNVGTQDLAHWSDPSGLVVLWQRQLKRACLANQLQPVLPILVREEDVFPPVTPGSDVVEATGQLNA